MELLTSCKKSILFGLCWSLCPRGVRLHLEPGNPLPYLYSPLYVYRSPNYRASNDSSEFNEKKIRTPRLTCSRHISVQTLAKAGVGKKNTQTGETGENFVYRTSLRIILDNLRRKKNIFGPREVRSGSLPPKKTWRDART